MSHTFWHRRGLAGAAILLTILVCGQVPVTTQTVAVWQFEDVAQGDFPDNCVRGMTVAGFEYGPDGRPVIAWREENDCGGKPRVYWTRQDAGLWQQSEFLSGRRYGGGAPGDYAHQLALRKSDGAPFLIYADVGSFNEINTYRDDLNAYSNGIASSTYLEGLAGPQNCAGVNYSLAFGPSDVTPVKFTRTGFAIVMVSPEKWPSPVWRNATRAADWENPASSRHVPSS